MAGTNFLQFDPSLENIQTDEEYENNTSRQNGVRSGIYPSTFHNKFAYQLSAMTTGLAQALVNKGFTVNDGSANEPGNDFDALVDVLGNLLTTTDIPPYGLDTGTVANVYVVALTPTLTSLPLGVPIHFRAASTNTGASTLAVDDLGAIPIRAPDGMDLIPGSIQAGQIVSVVYDGVTFQMVSADLLGRVAPTIEGGWYPKSSAADQTDPEEQGSIAWVLAQIGESEATMELSPGLYAINDNLTVPANVALHVHHGAVLEILSGRVLTINGPFSAGLYRCFLANPGGLVFGQGVAATYHPEWTGAGTGGDVLTYDSLSMQTLVDAVPSGSKIVCSRRYLLGPRTETILGTNYKLGFLVRKNGIAFESAGGDAGFKICDNFLASGSCFAVWLGDGTGHKGIKFLGVDVDGNRAGQTPGTFPFGVKIDSVKGVNVQGTNVHDCAGSGMATHGNTEGDIGSSTFENNALHGLELLCSPDPLEADHLKIVHFCRFIGNGRLGANVDIFGANESTNDKCVMLGCLFRDNGMEFPDATEASQLKFTHFRFGVLAFCEFEHSQPLSISTNVRIGNTYLPDNFVYFEKMDILTCKFTGDTSGYHVYNIGPGETLNVDGCDFRGAEGNLKYYILSRSSGKISGNTVNGDPVNNAVLVNGSDTSVVDNIFKVGTPPVKVQSLSPISGTNDFPAVDVNNIVIRGNKIYPRANMACAIIVSAQAESRMRNVIVAENPVFKGDYTIPTLTNVSAGGLSVGSLLRFGLRSGGTGYSAGNVLTLSQAGATSATLTVTSVDAGGAVTGAVLATAGANHSVANGLATTVAPSGGSGCTIDTTAVSPRSVVDFRIKIGGTGYSVGNVLTLSQAGATSATLTVTSVDAGGAVTGAVLATAGSGHEIAQTIETSVSPPGGTGCVINITQVTAGINLIGLDIAANITSGTSPVSMAIVGSPSTGAYMSRVMVRDKIPMNVVAFADGDPTPSVILAESFVTANTSPVSYSDFSEAKFPGKKFSLRFNDNFTTIGFSTAGALRGNGGYPWTATDGDYMTAEYDGARWWCTIVPGTRLNAVKTISLKLAANGSPLTAGSPVDGFVIPAELTGMKIYALGAHVYGASSSGLPTFTITKKRLSDGASVAVLSTALTIDVNERDSSTATTPAVIDEAQRGVATGDEYLINCTVAGTGTLGGEIWFAFRLP